MSSTPSPPRPVKAAPSSSSAAPSYQDRLRYAIDLLRQSEIEKSDLISKLSAAATPLPQRVKTIRRVVMRPTQNGETEEVSEEEEVEDERGEEEAVEEQKVAAVERLTGPSPKEEQERRARERGKQEAQRQERERERINAEIAEARKAASKPTSKAATPRGSLTSPPRKSTPVTPQREETKTTQTTPRRTHSSTSAITATTTPTRPARSAASPVVNRAPYSTPPSNRTVSRTKGSPTASSDTSSPAAAVRKSGGSPGGRERMAVAAPSENYAPAAPRRARSTSTSSSASTASSPTVDDSSILQTYIRFVLSPARLLQYRGALPASETRYETIEWLRVDEESEDELQSIHSESLKGREHDDELAVMINSKQLHDADMQRELCIQLWSHSNDVDAVDLNSDAAPEHDLLVQFTATVPELAQCANPDGSGEQQAEDEEDEERYQQIAEFFLSVEVVLHEEGDRREKDKRLELEIAIEQERMRLMQEGRSTSPLPPAAAPAAAASPTPATLRTPVKVRIPATAVSTASTTLIASGAATPQRRPSLTSVNAPTLASTGMPSMLDDFHDLIMADRVFARRQRQRAEEKRRQKRAAAAAAAGATTDGSSNTTSPTARSPSNSQTPSPHHSPASSQSNSPALSTRSLTPFTPFEPTYYRVKMTVRDLPKMNFHGSCDSYFHVLLSTSREAAAPAAPTTNTPPPPPASGTLQSLYRSEVQFNQLNPRFVSFVISSVRERDRDRLITLRMISWRQRVEEGHEEVIGEVTLPLSALIPATSGGSGSGGRAIESLTLTLLNPVREFIRMKTASVGVCVLEFDELDASTVSVDTMPSSGLKSVKQLNEGEKRVSKRREKESERVKDKERGEERT